MARPGLVLPALRPLTVSAQLLFELDELMEEVDPKGATEAVEGPTTDAAVEGLADELQVWSLTQFYFVDFSKLRIGGQKCVFYKHTIKVCVSCC